MGASRTAAGSRRRRNQATSPAGPTSSKRSSSCKARSRENSANLGFTPLGNSTSPSKFLVGSGPPLAISSNASATLSCPSPTSMIKALGNQRPAIYTKSGLWRMASTSLGATAGACFLARLASLVFALQAQTITDELGGQLFRLERGLNFKQVSRKEF